MTFIVKNYLIKFFEYVKLIHENQPADDLFKELSDLTPLLSQEEIDYIRIIISRRFPVLNLNKYKLYIDGYKAKQYLVDE